jgi:tryptophan 2,3-dioxygenase
MKGPTVDVTLPHDEIVRRIDAAWNDWIASIDGIDDETMMQSGASGDRSPADLAFHMAFWDEQAGYDIQFRHDNNGDAPPKRDWQRMNEQDHAAHFGRTPADARQVMQETHHALMVLVDAHRDDDLTWLVPELADHYLEHADELRAWRKP